MERTSLGGMSCSISQSTSATSFGLLLLLSSPQDFIHQSIEERPKAAETRKQFGHWEGDLVYSSFHKVYIVTLVERRSRYLLTGISKSKRPKEVADVLCEMLQDMPPRLV